MKIKCIPVNQIQENVYILYDENKMNCIVIDPGDINGEIIEFITENKLTVSGILLTHGHYDHILGVNKLREYSGAKVFISANAKKNLERTEIDGKSQFGDLVKLRNLTYFKDYDILNFDDIKVKCIETPGHSLGSSCFYVEDYSILFSGDTLFKKTVGRTDFYLSNSNDLLNSVREKLFTLPDDTIVCPGHGMRSEIGFEKKYNPHFN